MELHPLNHANGRNTFCGPAVISFATGISTADAAKLIRDRFNLRAVKGTGTREVRYVLEQAGIRMLRKPVDGTPTLAAWLRGSQEIRTEGRVFLLAAGDHWQLIHEDSYACGRVGVVVPVTHEKVMRRARVAEVYELVEMPDHREKVQELQDQIASKAARQKAKRAKLAKTQRDIKKRAAKYGVDIEVERLHGGNLLIYFTAPDEIEQARADGDLDFTAVAYDWDDASEILHYIIEAINDWNGAANEMEADSR